MGAQIGQGVTRDTATATRAAPVRHLEPLVSRGGLVVACPHSGRFYPPELLSVSILDEFALRRSEDAFVDQLFQDAPNWGARVLVNEFARAFVDVNRSPSELDPKLIHDLEPHEFDAKSERVKAGLGVIPRTVGDGLAIHKNKLSRFDAFARLMEVHVPWHRDIEDNLIELTRTNGAGVLLDCHSMPHKASGDPPCDIVLGDRFGASCAPLIMVEALSFLRSAGLNVARNDPYAGGYSTCRHGQPLRHHHALQIEINRGLYMVEGALTLRPNFDRLRTIMSGLVAHLVEVSERLGKERVGLVATKALAT
jgi:N-formylglutamate amidohydrolase